MSDARTNEVMARLMAERDAFLGFLERRVGDRAVAEDLLQEAFARAITRAATLREGEAVMGWFHATLRNAAIDWRRRKASAQRASEALSRELEGIAAVDDPPEALAESVCRCVSRLAGELKPEYAEALQRIEVDGVAVKDFADEAGVTRANAAQRVFRARQALKQRVAATCGRCAELGCVDCTCGH